MLELSATIILFGSFVGIGVIIIRKIPVLVELPVRESSFSESYKSKILREIKKKIKVNDKIKSFSVNILLQKILSKIRILTLKTDNKTSDWLIRLRQKSIEKKNNFSDNYWQKVKKK